MFTHQLNLSILPDPLAICRLHPHQAIPDWAMRGSLASITRTENELSVLCPQAYVPEDTRCERDLRCFKVEGPLPVDLVGIFAALTVPLAGAGIIIFALSTY